MGGRCYCGSSSRPWDQPQSLKHSKTHQDWEPTDNLSFLFPNSSEHFAGNILIIYEKTVTYFPKSDGRGKQIRKECSLPLVSIRYKIGGHFEERPNFWRVLIFNYLTYFYNCTWFKIQNLSNSMKKLPNSFYTCPTATFSSPCERKIYRLGPKRSFLPDVIHNPLLEGS